MTKEEFLQSLYKKYEERYGDILKIFSPDDATFWVLDVQSGRLLFSSTHIFPQDVPTRLSEWRALTHPDDVARVRAAWHSVVVSPKNGNSLEVFYRLCCPNGEYEWFLSKGTVVGRDKQGTALYVTGLAIPVSQLKGTLENAVVWQERITFALEAARDGLWDWNAETNDVYYSPRYLEMIGYTQEEFPPRLESWSSRIHPEDRVQSIHLQTSYIESPALGDTFECTYRVLAGDGAYRWIMARGKVVERGKDGRAKRLVGLHTDVTELHLAQEVLAELVNHDTLTKVRSRLYFEQAFGALTLAEYPVSVMYIDVDMLKLVNNLLGHDAGDKLLVTVADILRGAVRGTDLIARMGGDEFAVLMPNCPVAAAKGAACKLLDRLQQRNEDPDIMPVFLSVGVSGTDEGMALHDLVHAADQAMLRDKRQNHGANCERVQEWTRKCKGRNIRTEELPPSIESAR